MRYMYQGFETKEAAKAFIKEKGGGYLSFEERTPKRHQLTSRGKSYMLVVQCGGLNSKKYPYCVEWNEVD